MRITVLAGGIGAGKFLRGLVRVAAPTDITAIVNTADDLTIDGLHVSPDLDSVTYWLAGEMDRERGWGRRGETFRGAEELRRLAPAAEPVEVGAWFALGDLDLATHRARTAMLGAGLTLTEATARIAEGFGVTVRILPMTDDPVETRITVVASGAEVDLHFQDYWVRRRAADEVKAIRFAGAEAAWPTPEVLAAIAEADAILLCPSNPVVSIGPILALPGLRAAVASRRPRIAGVSPIVGGAPLAGMADKLMPSAGIEVTAAGVAEAYRDLLAGWVIDERDAGLAPRVEALGIRVAVTDTIMRDDDAAEAVAQTALDVLG